MAYHRYIVWYRNAPVFVSVWKIDDAINEVVDNITLGDLLDWQAASADDYVI